MKIPDNRNVEIDAGLALYVMGYLDKGWHSVAYQDEPVREWQISCRPPKYKEFKPTASIIDAMSVVDKICLTHPQEPTFTLTRAHGKRGKWTAVFSHGSTQIGSCTDKSRELAISKAAIKASEVR